tara:strand:- start:890 stop:1177 length:288 start_codon:yes stop_codon:yes gene_type:complete
MNSNELNELAIKTVDDLFDLGIPEGGYNAMDLNDIKTFIATTLRPGMKAIADKGCINARDYGRSLDAIVNAISSGDLDFDGVLDDLSFCSLVLYR